MHADTAYTPPSASAPIASFADRASFLARRLVGWLIDGALLSLVIGVSGFVLMLLATLVVGATVGLAGGGLEGLAAGGAAGFFAVIGVAIGMNAIAVAALLGYLAWAARRPGDVAGQTLGHQIAGVRIVRAADGSSPLRGRHLLGREIARYLWIATVAVPAVVVGATTGSNALGNLALLATVGAIVWSSAPDRLLHDRIAGTRVSLANAPR